jgi:hypothetical protein
MSLRQRLGAAVAIPLALQAVAFQLATVAGMGPEATCQSGGWTMWCSFGLLTPREAYLFAAVEFLVAGALGAALFVLLVAVDRRLHGPRTLPWTASTD